MKYVQPYGVSDENAPYINGNPSIGVAGSIPPAGAFEAPQREIVNAIASGGLVPSPSDMTQLSQVLSKIGVRFAIDTSSAAGSIVITPIPAIIDLSAPTMIAVKVGHDCPGASTLTYGTAAQYAAGTQVTKPVRRGDGTALQAGDYSNGGMLLLMFDGVNFQLVASGLVATDGGSGGSGTPGDPGQPGSQFYSGTTVPDSGLGINGDYYIRTTTYDLYKRASGSWGILLNFKGAAGVDAPTPNAVSLSTSSTITTGEFNYLIEFTGSSGFTTTLPTPVSNGGKGRYTFFNASSATQTLSTPAGTFAGPYGNGTTSMTLAAGAMLSVISDSANWIAAATSFMPPVPYGVGFYQPARSPGANNGTLELGMVVSGSVIAAYPSSSYGGKLLFDNTASHWQGIWQVVGPAWGDGYTPNWWLLRIS